MLVGFGEINITPRGPVTMGGYGDRKVKSAGTLDPIHARAIVLKDHDGNQAVIISSELIGLSRNHVEKIRDAVNIKTGIGRENIIIAVTHTHSGPQTHDYPTMAGASEAYMEWLIKSIPKAAFEAAQNLRECKAGWYQTEFDDVGASRRESRRKVKPYLTILGFVDMRGRLLGALFNYNCHPTVLSAENLLISADYPGAAIALLKRAYGKDAKFIFTNGACGDISTRFTRRAQDYNEVVRLGSLLGADVIKGLNKMEYKENCSISIKEAELRLEHREIPEAEELRNRIEYLKNRLEILKAEGAEHGEIRLAATALQGAMVLQLLREYEPHLEYDALVSTVKIGDGAIATLPVELFSSLGDEIIKASKLKPTMILGYANGSLGYMPDETSYREGGYESFSCRFARGEGERLRDFVIALLNELE